jgi:hypothetical protein
MATVGDCLRIELTSRSKTKVCAPSIHPTLVVVHGTWQWAITGEARVFQPNPVLQAWRQASAGTVPKPA